MIRTFVPVTASLALAVLAVAQSSYPPVMPGAEVETYKTIGDVKMNVWIYNPEGHRPTDSRPAIVFFFGGGWRQGTPRQFAPQSEYLASRGMVAISADYRVSSRNGVKAVSCVEDAKSALRWVRQNAKRLGIDPDRIAAGGGSAGGHLAGAIATITDFDAAGEDLSVSSVPNALALFNPALVMADLPGRPMPPERAAGMEKRMGVNPEKLSPIHHLDRGGPPAIIFHGEADTTVPYETSVAFCKKSKELGNRCELVGYEGETHGFFNYGRGDRKAYYDTLKRTDEFFVSLGWLHGEPTILTQR